VPLRYVLSALTVAFLWGANFTAAKIGMEHFPAFLMLAVRFALVAMLLLPAYYLVKRRKGIRLAFALKIACILGTAHFGLVFGAMYLGSDIPTAVITVQLGVPFSCLLSAVWFDDKLGAWRSFGLMVAFVGIILIAGTPNVTQYFVPFCMVVAGAFFWALSNVMIKKEGTVNVLEMLGWMSLFAVPQLLALSWFFEHPDPVRLLATANVPVWLGVGFSAVFSTVVAYGLWYWLLMECDVSRVAPFNLLVPVFAIGIGQWWYPAVLTPQILMGGLITVAGVGIIVFRRPKLSTIGRTWHRRNR
jgi:O-acetylserine/cysteine efflux transporter